jgi:hypothetical protein
MPRPNRDVFVNCPFDDTYLEFFRATIFVIVRSGFRPRCALETDDGSENRFKKICAIIAECSYGIHDISRTELDAKSKLPRFNMPLELGVFLAAKRFGSSHQKSKRCIIFDVKRYRYQKFISDIAGQDIHSHDGNAAVLIKELASWLRSKSRDPKVPGGHKMVAEFRTLKRAIPAICAARGLEPGELTYDDYVDMLAEYLTATS